MNGLGWFRKWKDLFKLYFLLLFCGKLLGMNMLDICDLIGEIVVFFLKICFFLLMYKENFFLWRNKILRNCLYRKYELLLWVFFIEKGNFLL